MSIQDIVEQVNASFGGEYVQQQYNSNSGREGVEPTLSLAYHIVQVIKGLHDPRSDAAANRERISAELKRNAQLLEAISKRLAGQT